MVQYICVYSGYAIHVWKFTPQCSRRTRRAGLRPFASEGFWTHRERKTSVSSRGVQPVQSPQFQYSEPDLLNDGHVWENHQRAGFPPNATCTETHLLAGLGMVF